MERGESKVWFITGASKGFGRIWAEAALARGDRVAATARDPRALDGLVDRYGELVLPLQLNVDDKAADDAAVARAHEHFGRLDVLVNNAGYGLFGAIEEVSEEQARQQLETNVFGALWVTKAALPIMREQGSGHILQVSSIGGVQAFPGIGLYHASKWALEGFSQSLAGEVGPLGIHVTLIEPIGYETDWAGPSAVVADPLPAYEPIREVRKTSRVRNQRGTPEATAAAILAVVDSDDPPLRLFLGQWALDMIREEYANRLEVWERWQPVAASAHE
ncbi:MAG TPA: SDR family NAD(P)-dependent oxidoreductase [Solirubrobacterales bacterium]|nr:SDR family NAD(P)-dependent oxidoreductase [Solirubrobacterales bacterium]